TRGDSVVTESDAMASMSSSITLRTRWSGGFFSAILRRLFGGESLFMNEYSTASSGELVLTQPTPGDIECLELKGQSMYLQAGAFVGCDPTVQMGLGFAGFASLFAREGLFRLRLSGHGRLWFGAYGGIIVKEIQDEYVVDSGHLVAYEPSVNLRIGLAGGIFSSLFSGEGLVLRLKGPGRVYLQSRSIDALASWVNGHL
ncbi:MAG TPA: TIGR00266 family protein, partial [Polyangiales bacterium]|nr:TIGR00266 family protein [Polyangiales bacterium]